MASSHADQISGCGQGAPNFQVPFLANWNLLRIPFPEVSVRSVHTLSVLCGGCGKGVPFPRALLSTQRQGLCPLLCGLSYPAIQSIDAD